MSESEGMCPSREELQGPRCGPLGGCKLHKEESVLRIRKVSQAVKKASAECRLRLCVCVCGGEVQGGAGGGLGGWQFFGKKWQEQASVHSRTLPALRTLGQETFGRQVQRSGGVPTGIRMKTGMMMGTVGQVHGSVSLGIE